MQGIVIVIGYWTKALSTAAWISISWLTITLVNIGAMSLFGEIEVVTSSIKFGWILVIIITCTVILAGGAPNDEGPIGFRYWNSDPFTNGFKGFLTVLPTCVFAMSGSENADVVACETTNPQRSVPKAVKLVWMRLALFFILGGLAITITVDPNNPILFGASGSSASPFVIAFEEGNLVPLAHMMNAVILISVLSTGSVAVYAGSRTLVGLSQVGMAPTQMMKADKLGRSWVTLVPTLVVGGSLAYLNVPNTGAQIFVWFSNLSALFTLFGWASICLSCILMRRTWTLQGRSLNAFPWKSPANP